MKIIYVREKISHNKNRLCGWSSRELEYRVDYKTRKTRFVTYKGYCQWDYEQFYGDVGDEFNEEIHIYAEYRHSPTKMGTKYSRFMRSGSDGWGSKTKFYKERLDFD